MQTEFEMSMIGELSYFLGLQVKQSSAGIFISQEKYLKEMLKKFQMEDSSPVSTSMVVGCKLSKDDIFFNVYAIIIVLFISIDKSNIRTRSLRNTHSQETTFILGNPLGEENPTKTSLS
jgi:hypothetical protein